MSNRKRHEEHTNHEAWAIPYGDLVTLLLAFFVVMYSISTVNISKYRAMSESLDAAFSGTPHSIDPIQVGAQAIRSTSSNMTKSGLMLGNNTGLLEAGQPKDPNQMTMMDQVISEIENTMPDPIKEQSLQIHRKDDGVEIELSSDVLFPSGSSILSADAVTVLQKLAAALKPLPYPIRVEGHTDNVPIKTTAFPSNWELSAARAASVVGLFISQGINPGQLAVVGFGEFRPVADNQTAEGRDHNRRVIVLIPTTENDADRASAPDSTPPAGSAPVMSQHVPPDTSTKIAMPAATS